MLKYAEMMMIRLAALLAFTCAVQGETNNTEGRTLLNRCTDFKDFRNLTSDDIIIPANLANTNETIQFGIDTRIYDLACTKSFLKTIKWEHGIDSALQDNSTFRGNWLLNSSKFSNHFTYNGYFQEESSYYKPDNYCVKSIADVEIEIRICNVSCDAGKICIPKCCGVDEILIYGNFTCRKIMSQEPQWRPTFYKTSYPYNEISIQTDQIQINRQRPDCEAFQKFPLSSTSHANSSFEIPWKLLPNKRPIYQTREGEWKRLPDGDFCVDGYANGGNGGNETYSGHEKEHSVLLLCSDLISPAKLDNWNKTTEKEVTVTTNLNRCSNFIDIRYSSSDDISVTLPANLTNTIQPVNFRIRSQTYKLPCTESFSKTVKWEHGTDFIQFSSRIKGHRLYNSGKTSSHFTYEGYFHDDTQYYRPDDYCVQAIDDTEIELRICNVTCGQEGRICIPKCCGADEILVYWNFTCRKITAEERKWNPRIYQPSYPHKEISDQKNIDDIHIYRKRLNCTHFDQWPLSNALRAKIKDEMDFEIPWKLVPNQKPVYLTYYRKWEKIPDGEYCIDGFANWGFGGNGTYTGRETEHSVILICPSSNRTTAVQFEAWKAWVYSVCLGTNSIFLFLTALIHLLLLDKQHLHGLTVLCYAISMYLMYIFCTIAQIVSIYPELKGKPRSGFCLSIAILSHYFFMTSFAWLSIMNFDLWLTFRSMRPVSKMSKRIRRFRLYSVIGWGLPAILSSIFYTMDEVYRDRKTEVVVPDYADKNCFVAIWSRGYFMYSLVAIALTFNTVLILWTFYIFYEFRKQNANTFTTKRTKSDKYSVRLFVKLFCVMGIAWFVELLSWYYNGAAKPLAVVVLDCLMYFQGLAIFIIFCINRRTLKQLEDKYPCLKRTIGPLRTFTWFRYSDVDGVEMTTPGNPRKLSLSVTTNTKIDSTLPRKTSHSSTRSGSTSSNNKYMLNSKGRLETLESVSLDSECEPNVILESHSKIKCAPDLVTST